MIIKLFEAGQEIKSYNNFESLELKTVFRDGGLNCLSEKYNLKFFGDSREIIRAIIWEMLERKEKVNICLYAGDKKTLIIDNLKASKDDFFSSIFHLIVCKSVEPEIAFFNKDLIIYFKELNIEYNIRFLD